MGSEVLKCVKCGRELSPQLVEHYLATGERPVCSACPAATAVPAPPPAAYSIDKPHRSADERQPDRIHELTPRKSGVSLEHTLARINRVFQGWFNYFRHCTWTIYDSYDARVRKRLRRMLMKRHRCNRRRLSRHSRWPNAYFTDHGFRSLREAHNRFVQSHAGNY